MTTSKLITTLTDELYRMHRFKLDELAAISWALRSVERKAKAEQRRETQKTWAAGVGIGLCLLCAVWVVVGW